MAGVISPRVPGGRDGPSTLVTWSPEEFVAVSARAAKLGVRLTRLVRESALADGGASSVEERAERRAGVSWLMGLERSLSVAVLVLRGEPGAESVVEEIRVTVGEIRALVRRLAELGV